MSIFRRRPTRDAPDTDATTEPTDQVAGAEPTDEVAGADPSAEPQEESREEEPLPDPAPAYDRAEGPFDAAEIEGLGERLDLGALWVTGIEGMELRLEVDQEQDAVVAATAIVGDSAVQLQAFAAPKSGGQWAEIRDEIAQSVVRSKGTAQVKQGPFGAELWTTIPTPGAGGRTTSNAARFAGVDGPRWFLRAVFSGRAATDEQAAAPLVDFVRSAVVVRGDSPMAPRELLPLAVPTGEDQASGGAEDAQTSLDPFERGPEITEVR